MIGLARRGAKRIWLAAARRADLRRRRELGLLERDLPPELWDAGVDRTGHMTIGGCDVVELAERFGTPLYVVDRSRLERNYTTFVQSFRAHHPHVELDYSYKTNPLPGALRELHRMGAGAEVISPYELWLALELDVSPARITFNGPAKTDRGLELAVNRGIRLINVDNLSEIDKIEALAAAAGRMQQVGVRVTTSVGWSSQFGLSLSTGAAWAAFERARLAAHLDPCGIHLHLGTGLKDTAVYVRAIREVLELARALDAKLGIRIRYFDLGGGFGVPTVRSYSDADHRLMLNGYPPQVMDVTLTPPISTYAALIGELFRGAASDPPPTLIFEPGRSVSSSAQSLILRVLAVKPAAGGGHHAILDGGLNVAMPTSFEYHEVFPASKMNEPPSAAYDLCGPLCHPSDVVRRRKRMPRLEPGDVIALMDAGAYFIPNQMNFSNPRAAAVLVDRAAARTIRRREAFDDVVRLDVPAEPVVADRAAALGSNDR
jgi:diaminopimelate decarboxylase